MGFGGQPFSRFHFGEDQLGALVEPTAYVGQALAPGGALQKLDAQVLFQLPDLLPHQLRRYPKRLRCCAEGTEFDRLHKDRHRAQSIHSKRTVSSEAPAWGFMRITKRITRRPRIQAAAAPAMRRRKMRGFLVRAI